MGKFKDSFKNWKIPRIMWTHVSKKARELLGLIKTKGARSKKNEEATPTAEAPRLKKNKSALNKKNEEPTPMHELPGSIKNETAWNESDDESALVQELLGLIKDESAWNKKSGESTPNFPLEVIIEILSWLPLKYLSQVQLVCKEWKALIDDHYFIEKHMGRSLVVYHWYNVVWPVINLKRPDSFSYIHGCDGLVLLKHNISQKYFIWNPAICRVLELPDPHDGTYGLALSFVPTTRNYRIVSIFKDRESGGEGCEVLTPGHSNTWRRLAFPDIVNSDTHTLRENVSVVSTGRAVHCVLIIKVGNETVAEIVTLDLETECFIENRVPNCQFCDMKTVWQLDWDGKLAFAEIVGRNLQLMELEYYKKQKWCEKKKIIPLPFLKDFGVEGNVFPLFNTQGDIWFWLKNKKIFVYTIKTERIYDIMPVRAFSLESKLYPYKPSLVGFEGMQPDTDLEKFRPRFRFD